MTVTMVIKAVIVTLFTVTQLYVFLFPSGSLIVEAWALLVALDALIIGYYMRKRHLAPASSPSPSQLPERVRPELNRSSTVTMMAKAVVVALFTVTQLYVIFLPSGSLNMDAWVVLVALDALIIGYYVRKRHFAR